MRNDAPMILTAHQPAYLPWLGYLDKIARADVFVYLDTVQFERNSYINRNRIKTPQGVQWLTIPVKMKGHLSMTLRDTESDVTQRWHVKHLKAIAMNYRRAPHFTECFAKLERLVADVPYNLAELCWRQLRFWLDEFAIATHVVRASELPVNGSKSDLILQLARHFGANHYLSGALGRGYLAEDAFRASGISVEYQEYHTAVYPQLWGDFVPDLSVVDYWMHCGPSAALFREATG
jgi:hypothetical protein